MMSQESDSDPLNESKAQLRKVFKDKRRSLDDEVRRTCHSAIANHLAILLAAGNGINNLAVYFSSPDEVDLAAWMESAWSAGKHLYAPVVMQITGQMDFYPINATTKIERGRFNLRKPLLEDGAVPALPENLDAVLLPLVSFDTLGGRLGMGGGFYDRYFAESATRPWMIGVAYNIQHSEQRLPAQPWDIPLDALVTESGYRIFAAQHSADLKE